MECINNFFPVIIYVLTSILLLTLIILSIKAMKTLKKINETLDEMTEKVNKFSELFDIIDSAKDMISTIGDKIVGSLVNGVVGLLSKKTRKEENENE